MTPDTTPEQRLMKQLIENFNLLQDAIDFEDITSRSAQSKITELMTLQLQIVDRIVRLLPPYPHGYGFTTFNSEGTQYAIN